MSSTTNKCEPRIFLYYNVGTWFQRYPEVQFNLVRVLLSVKVSSTTCCYLGRYTKHVPSSEGKPRRLLLRFVWHSKWQCKFLVQYLPLRYAFFPPKHTVERNRRIFPDLAYYLKDNFYADNLLDSFDNDEQAKQVLKKRIQVICNGLPP